MKHLLSEWPAIQQHLCGCTKIGLFLDFDGTLARIVGDPYKVKLKASVREMISRLSRKKNLVVGILTGRDLKQTKNFLKVKGIYYAGNHGLEIEGPKFLYRHPQARVFRPRLRRICSRLKEKVGDIKGVVVEEKNYSLSVHFRAARETDLRKIKREFDTIVRKFILSKQIRVTGGKKVLEIRPPVDWNKGDALKNIRARALGKDSLVIFIGDDITDEDGFAVLKRQDCAVRVGQKKDTHARYFLRDPHEVELFLNCLEVSL